MDIQKKEGWLLASIQNINIKILIFLNILYLFYTMQKQHLSYKYIIVGCGISALQAALILAENQQNFIILQASNRFGGRICSLTLGQALKDCPDNSYQWLQNAKESPIDCGGTWISEDHTFMLNFVKQFELNLTTQYYEGRYIYAQNPQKYHSSEKIGDYYNRHQAQLLKLLKSLQDLKKTFDHLTNLKQSKNISQSQLADLNQFYEKYDNISAFDFMKDEVKDEELAKIIDKELSTLQCCKATEYSAFDLILDQSEPFANIKFFIGLQSANIDGFRLKEGMLRMCEKLKAEIQKVFDIQGEGKNIDDLIKLNNPVAQIRNNKVPVEVVTQNNQTYLCQKAIVCLPGATFHRIKFDHLSQSKKIFVDNQIYCNMTRMAMVFPQPFWRQKYSGYVSFSHNFPMNQVVELTPESAEYGVIAFVFCADGYQQWNQSILSECKSKEGEELKKEWYQINKKKALRIVADLFLEGNINSPHLSEVAIFAKSMSDSPYIKSSYGSIAAMSTACRINQLGKQAEHPIEDENNVIVLGSDFSSQFTGYMEGAIRVARKKIYALCNKPDPLESLGANKSFSPTKNE